MLHTQVIGGGGARLHVVETGNRRGRPIVFIHGFSQSCLSWRRQLCSDLADDFRLVAMDLRGHGRSDKPREGYDDHGLWADDVNAIMHELNLEQPVLCGWSYGPLVILDYIRRYGEDAIAGWSIVGGLTKLGSSEALSFLTPELLNLVPGFFSTQAEEATTSLKSLLRMFFVSKVSPEDLYQMLGYNLAVPPYVREGLFSRSFDNDDLLPKLRKPVLVIHGAEDAVVKPAVVDQHTSAIAHARAHVLPNAGHAPFWDDAATFNQHLRTFCESL
jgi:pimeloyl-ACP methyl ester carboxylesterase